MCSGLRLLSGLVRHSVLCRYIAKAVLFSFLPGLRENLCCYQVQVVINATLIVRRRPDQQ